MEASLKPLQVLDVESELDHEHTYRKGDRLYKVLMGDKSFHGGEFTWSLPTEVDGGFMPGEWHEVDGEPQLCEHGFHLTRSPHMWYCLGSSIYEAERSGRTIIGISKVVTTRVRLLRPVIMPVWCDQIAALANRLDDIRKLGFQEGFQPNWILENRPSPIFNAFADRPIVANMLGPGFVLDEIGCFMDLRIHHTLWEAIFQRVARHLHESAPYLIRHVEDESALRHHVFKHTWIYAMSEYIFPNAKSLDPYRQRIREYFDAFTKGYVVIRREGNQLFVRKISRR